MTYKDDLDRGNIAIAFVLALAAVPVAAWFTHIFVCLAAGKWGFLIAGALFVPIAVIHGLGIWFGFW